MLKEAPFGLRVKVWTPLFAPDPVKSTRKKCSPNGSGNPDETLELVGEMLMTIDEDCNGRHHGLGPALPGEHDERLWPARALAGWCGLLSAWRSGGVRLRRWA